MKKLMLSTLLGGLVASSAFAYSTRPMTVEKGTDASGRITATCTFAEDTTGLVTKYNLYVVWGDVDAGRAFAKWGLREKVAEIEPATNGVTVQIPSAALRAKCMRLFLAEPTLVSRSDGIEFVEYVQSDGNVLVGAGYTPNKATAIDCEFEVPNTMDKNAFYTLFCARNMSDSADHKTYTMFLRRNKDGSGYTFRLDYGKKSSTETMTDLGFAIANRMRLTTEPNADGSSLTATLVNGKSIGRVTTSGELLNGAGNELTLFGCTGKNLNDGRGNYAKNRYWGFRAFEAGSLKLNLLPAKKTETVDGVEKTTYGFYDTVSGAFKASLTTSALTGGCVMPFCESSELFSFENESGAERGLHYIPAPSQSGNYVQSVAFNFPESDSPIPYVLKAVTTDGVATRIASIGQEAQSFAYTLPMSRGKAEKATVTFRLEPDLPAGYELLPYVVKKRGADDTAGAYITTDYMANGTTSVHAKMRFLAIEGETSAAWAVFCSRSADSLKTDNPGQALFVAVNNGVNYWRYDYGSTNGANADRVFPDTVYTFRAGATGGLQVSSERGDSTAYAEREAEAFTSKGGTMLFASYKSIGTKDGNQTFGGVGNNRRTDIYWFTMSDANGAVFTLVPVKCTLDGENKDKVGFWDFANQRFCSSASNTAFEAPTTEEKSPLVVETEAFTAPEKIGVVVMLY